MYPMLVLLLTAVALPASVIACVGMQQELVSIREHVIIAVTFVLLGHKN
jgi:hypothetical protein